MLVPYDAEPRLRRLTPATTVAEIAQTLLPEPLRTREELDAFYNEGVQRLRGMDRMRRMRLCMEDSLANGLPFKAFLMGHPGVGKTTEIEHLLLGMQSRFRHLRLSVTSELNPGTLRFYDVLLLILIRLVQEASSPKVIGFEDHDLELLLKRVRDHLATNWTKHLDVKSTEMDAGAGVQISFLKLLGNIKQGRTREQGSHEYELSFVSELVTVMNEVFAECNRLLAKHQNGQQWLIVLEDFEKIGLDEKTVKQLFVGLRPSLQDMSAHLIVTIPVWLHYSEDANFILPPNFQPFLLPDIAVYGKDHLIDSHVVRTLAEVVTARASDSLFEPRVLERCCLASGGNIRDLFTLIREAMLSARLRGAASISLQDAAEAIDSLRNEYKQRLGVTAAEQPKGVPLEDKLKRLLSIYQREDETAEVPNPVLYSLLGQRCVLQYNGAGWMGVHPLVVDLLIDFGRLQAGSPGGSRLPE